MLRPGHTALTVLLGALIAVAPVAMDVYLPSMPSMTRALATSAEKVQLTLSLYMYVWGFSQLLAGPMSDRYGRKPALLGGLALFVVASVACALSRNIETLIAARGLQALGMATVAVVPRAIARDLYSGERAAHLLALMGMVLGIAPVVAPVLGSQLHVLLGWQANFAFVALFGAALLAWVLTALPETLRTRNRDATRPSIMLRNYLRLLRSRRYVGYLLLASFGFGGLFAFLAGSSFVFIDVMHRSEREFGLLFACIMLGNITGALLSSRLGPRLGIDRTIRASSWLMLIAGIAMATLSWAGVNHPAAIVVPMFAYMVSLMTTMPQAMAGALTPFADIAGGAAALLSFCQFLLASTTALLVGIVFDGTSRPMTTAIALAAVLSFASFAGLIHRERSRSVAPRDRFTSP
ncbi:MAG TPA: multidrug effflux MFS transporter [Casimicrobiaceae bacterium]|nr:multidrug effflux MFS transporter [Casimicrobiaceae bacterium]